MPGRALIDPTTIDIRNPRYDIEEIRRRNKHRFEFEMLTGITLVDLEKGLAAGFKQLSPEDFWVRGHVPGRPLFPGVLQIESCAQLTSFYWMELKGNPADTFLGFLGVEHARFRGFVGPNDTFIVAVHAREIRPRRCTFYCQAFVDGKMVFDGTVLGAPM